MEALCPLAEQGEQGGSQGLGAAELWFCWSLQSAGVPQGIAEGISVPVRGGGGELCSPGSSGGTWGMQGVPAPMGGKRLIWLQKEVPVGHGEQSTSVAGEHRGPISCLVVWACVWWSALFSSTSNGTFFPSGSFLKGFKGYVCVAIWTRVLQIL